MVGKTIELNSLPFTVIGIAPAKFSGLVRGMICDVWVPMMMTPQMMRDDDTLESRGTRSLSLLGRLKPGVTVKQAQAQFDILAAQQFTAYRQEWTESGGEGRVITVLPESQSRIPAAALDKALGVAGLITASLRSSSEVLRCYYRD